jgi:small-conductance mechanosensitive channel
MTWPFGDLSQWASRIGLSVLALVVTYLLGHFARRVVAQRLGRLARATPGHWDDTVVKEVSRRIPFWGLLLGVYLAAGFWTLPPNFANALNKALFVAAAASGSFLAANILASLAHAGTLRGALPVTSLTQNIIRIVVLVIGLTIVLNGLGLSMTPIVTALGVGGLAVALALQDTLSNLFAGFYVTMSRQIRVGDYVQLESGHEGYLVDIAWRAARIRMLANNTIVVPNAKLAQSIVTNYHLPDQELAVSVEVGVDYGNDLQHVERVTLEVAGDVLRSVQGGVPAFTPLIRYHTFGDSRIGFTVILRAREFVDQYLLKHEFVKRLHKRYQEERIAIPVPVRTVVQRNGTAT